MEEKCPFYKFIIKDNKMIEVKEGKCALNYSCLRLKKGKEINWFKCPFNTEETKEDLEEIRVFPEIFSPTNGRSWKGLRVKDWIEYYENIRY